MNRAMVLEELALSQREGHEVVPRFRVLAPDGEHTIMVQFPDDLEARMERLQVVRAFMIWKAARGFVHSAELFEPDAISACAVMRDDVTGGLQRIRRKPLGFGEVEWLDRTNVVDDMLQLLPPRMMTLDRRDLEFIDKAFEEGGVPGIPGVRRVI
jgi:hypothetical protein